VLLPYQQVMLGWGDERSTAVSSKSSSAAATMGVDIGKNSFHIIGLDERGAIVLRQKWSRGQLEARLATLYKARLLTAACQGAQDWPCVRLPDPRAKGCVDPR
jgi:transposase